MEKQEQADMNISNLLARDRVESAGRDIMGRLNE